MNKVVVIGGGPSGLMAAGQAALRGLGVILLEKKNEPAQKLRITGNGRCNLTNTLPVDDFIPHFGRNGKFLKTAFAEFHSKELVRFFESIGVKTSIDHRGRAYPKSDSADDVADALIGWVRKCGVKTIKQAAVRAITLENGKIVAVQIQGWKQDLEAETLILATGGASYPGTGSTGDGYRLAESVGHKIVPIRPASVPLVTEVGLAGKLKGTGLREIRIRVKVDGKAVAETAGDLLFTHYGLSGPAVLNISRICVDELRLGRTVSILLDMIPDKSENQLEKILLGEIDQHGGGQIQSIIKAWLPHRMAPIFLSEIGIKPSMPCSQITAGHRRKIKGGLKGLEIKIVGHCPLAEAQVTAGGVSLKEVDPRTMESRLIKGLYFAGEVLDLNADTGGFNLQAAFSTGWLAGRNCLG